MHVYSAIDWLKDNISEVIENYLVGDPASMLLLSSFSEWCVDMSSENYCDLHNSVMFYKQATSH